MSIHCAKPNARRAVSDGEFRPGRSRHARRPDLPRTRCQSGPGAADGDPLRGSDRRPHAAWPRNCNRMFSERRIAGVDTRLRGICRERVFHTSSYIDCCRLEVPAGTKTFPHLLPPIINLQPRRLFDDIVEEYFFATLENAAMQSFFSENSTRFRTMEAAHQNIANKSGELTKLMRRIPPDSTTTEILDLIGGTQALAAAENCDSCVQRHHRAISLTPQVTVAYGLIRTCAWHRWCSKRV